MATPMSAAFRAGASLTPSPVTAVVCPLPCRACTIRSLCVGLTRAKTGVSSTRSASSSSDSCSTSRPVSTGSSASAMPSCSAMASAVPAWSPVIMMTRTPAAWQRAMDSFTPGRGGSMMPCSPRNVSAEASGSSSGSGAVSRSRAATARTRNPRPAIASATSSMAATCNGPPAASVHRSRMASGAPLT